VYCEPSSTWLNISSRLFDDAEGGAAKTQLPVTPEADAEVDRMLEERYRRRRQRACIRHRPGSRKRKDEFCDTMTDGFPRRRTGRRPAGSERAAAEWCGNGAAVSTGDFRP